MSDDNISGGRKKEYGMQSGSSDVDESEKANRQCTSSRPAVYVTMGEIPASPSKFISLEELMRAANGVTNMVLAHEIAINKDFKLETHVAQEKSFKNKLKDVVQKVCWDVLETELAEDPPNYTLAMVLLTDIKKGLLELLLPQHKRIHQQISEVLDINLIKQQADAGILDFQQYAQYVISLMGKLCAPIRDEKISSLTKTTNMVEIFKGILETIDLMKLDMANFTINLIRPQIVASSIQYEKKKFQDFLNLNQDGLVLTKQWLKKHVQVANQHIDKRKKINAVINDAYLELLEWNEDCYEFPETVIMDKGRILELKQQFEKLSLAGAVLLLTFVHSGPDLSSIDEFKQKVKNNILILLKNNESDQPEDVKRLLEEITEKLKHDIQGAVDQYGVKGGQTSAGYFSTALSELVAKDNKIRHLLRQRIKEFLLVTITSQTTEPVKIPSGFSTLQQEVTEFADNFLRLTSHNRAVYEEYYTNILEEFLN